MAEFAKRLSRKVRRSSQLAARKATCGAHFNTLFQETQNVLVQCFNELPQNPLPEYLIVLNQDDVERKKQCLLLDYCLKKTTVLLT